MKVQPAVEVFVSGTGWALLGNQTGMWTHFSEFGQATLVYEKVKEICPDAILFDGTKHTASGQGFLYLDQVTRLWEITGTMPDGSTVDELCGDLFDAMSTPRPFIDTNPDGTLGGPNLKATVFSGNAQLSWSK